jgi:hypothetical protein
MNPEDDLKIDSDTSTPESEYDFWFTLTHKNTKASWDVAEDDDSDDLDIDPIESDED